MILACSINIEGERSADCVLVDTSRLSLEVEHEQTLRFALELDDVETWNEIEANDHVNWSELIDCAVIPAPALVVATRMVFLP